MTSTAKVGAQGPPLGQHQGNSSIRRTCRQLVMASFAFVGLFYAVVGSHLGQGDELKMFSGKINDVGATVGNDSGLFAGWASAPKVDIGASVVGIKTTWQKFGDDPSCNPVDWQEIVSAIDTGKSPPMNTTMTIVHTSKAVTSTYAPSASQLDPTGVMAAQGFTEDYSRPGAILVLLSDKFLHPVKPLNKLYASHMVKSLADNWYKKDLSRTKYDLIFFTFPSAKPKDLAKFNKTIALSLPPEVRVIFHPYALGTNIPYPEVADHFGLKESYFTTCGLNPKKQFWTAEYLGMTVFRVLSKFKVPLLRAYKYVWELDADSVFDKAPCDVFDVMSRGKFVHGYYEETMEPSYCPQNGFTESMVQYGRQNRLCTSKLAATETNLVWDGKFHIYDMRLFASSFYTSAAEAFIKTGGLWEHRWTDQTWWPRALALIAPGKSHQFSGFSSRHKGQPTPYSRDGVLDPACSPQGNVSLPP